MTPEKRRQEKIEFVSCLKATVEKLPLGRRKRKSDVCLLFAITLLGPVRDGGAPGSIRWLPMDPANKEELGTGYPEPPAPMTIPSEDIHGREHAKGSLIPWTSTLSTPCVTAQTEDFVYNMGKWTMNPTDKLQKANRNCRWRPVSVEQNFRNFPGLPTRSGAMRAR